MITRTSRLNLSFSNTLKKEYLRNFILQYKALVNLYIDVLWGSIYQNEKYIPYSVQKSVETNLSARMQQCAGLRALKIIKSQLRNPKLEKIKPEYKASVVELDERFVKFYKTDSGLFNEIFQFRSGDRSKILCPIKFHKHFNSFNESWVRKKSVRIRIFHDQIYLDVFFEKEFEPIDSHKTIGVDVGIKKLMVDSDGNFYGTNIESLIDKVNRKQPKSNAWYRAIQEKNCYINETMKRLPIANYVLEDIKRIRHGIKNNPNKTFRNKTHFWTYKKIIRGAEMRAEVVGVQCLLVSPSYTSQTCSVCGDIHKINRHGEVFQCVNCGHTEDADYNASKNILHRGFIPGVYGPRKEESFT